MADTSIGIHSHDHPSEWALFDFGQLDPPSLLPDPTFNPNAQLPHYAQTPSGGIQHELPNLSYSNQAPPNLHGHPPSGGAFDTQVSDNVNHGPLTQEQLNALETSFTAVPKPKRESREGLAKKIGLDTARVHVGLSLDNSPRNLLIKAALVQ